MVQDVKFIELSLLDQDLQPRLGMQYYTTKQI